MCQYDTDWGRQCFSWLHPVIPPTPQYHFDQKKITNGDKWPKFSNCSINLYKSGINYHYKYSKLSKWIQSFKYHQHLSEITIILENVKYWSLMLLLQQSFVFMWFHVWKNLPSSKHNFGYKKVLQCLWIVWKSQHPGEFSARLTAMFIILTLLIRNGTETNSSSNLENTDKWVR